MSIDHSMALCSLDVLRDNFLARCWKCEHMSSAGDPCDGIFCMRWEWECHLISPERMLVCTLDQLEAKERG
jgi:hypothetical protein